MKDLIKQGMDGIRLFCSDGNSQVKELISEVREASSTIQKRVFTMVELRQPQRRLIVGPLEQFDQETNKLKIKIGEKIMIISNHYKEKFKQVNTSELKQISLLNCENFR